jgi:hypothetical protein
MRIARKQNLLASPALVAALGIVLASAGSARGALPPVKLVLTSRIGWEVNTLSKGDLCLVASEACKEGVPSGKAGGFEHPENVGGGAAGGNVYVADRANQRIQELSATGEFVAMFGKNVNKDGSNLCTKAEESECQRGEASGSAEAFYGPRGIAVDPSGGIVYVLDENRVDEYTSAGQFLLMIGKEVNKKGGNVCTKAEASECQVGVQSAPNSTEKGAFRVHNGGDLLAVGGGPEHLLFVGDEHRVQEFIPGTGEFKREIALPAAVVATAPDEGISAIAVDDQTEVVYVGYANKSIVREYDATSGQELTAHIQLSSREPNWELDMDAMALDSSGRLAVVLREHTSLAGPPYFLERIFGSLNEDGSGRPITQFQLPPLASEIPTGIGFNSEGELYGALSKRMEVWRYKPEPVGEFVTESNSCKAGTDVETDATFDCTLSGQANPYGVPATEAWFEWGRTCSLGSQTPKQQVAASEAISGEIEGLRPNETFCYRAAGADQIAQPPEELTGEKLSLTTPVTLARTIGEPDASFVSSTAAVLHGSLNPENAPTRYFFEYGSPPALEACPGVIEAGGCAGVMSTSVLESSVYAPIDANLDASGLRPDTQYAYRLAAGNQAGQSPPGAVGLFTTAGLRTAGAQTGAASVNGATSAIVSGTLEPDGQAATYVFELGVYEGESTQYGIVFSGSVAAVEESVAESLQLTGLQPGTTYAYRIAIRYGDGSTPGSSATGVVLTFTTDGVPSVLASPTPATLLALPNVVFPVEAAKVTSKKLSRAQKLALALKACGKRRVSQRASCKRAARKKYGAKGKAKR